MFPIGIDDDSQYSTWKWQTWPAHYLKQHLSGENDEAEASQAVKDAARENVKAFQSPRTVRVRRSIVLGPHLSPLFRNPSRDNEGATTFPSARAATWEEERL